MTHSALMPSARPDLQALIDASREAVVVADRAGRIVAANRAGESLFGYGAGELNGLPVEALVPARARQRHESVRHQYSSAPTARLMSARQGLTAVRRDGSEFPVEVLLAPVAGSELGLVMAVVHSIPGPLAGEAANAGFEAMHDAVITTDASGTITFLNRAAMELAGTSLALARGQSLREVLPLTEAARPDTPLDPIARSQHSRQFESCEATFPGRVTRTLDVSVNPIQDPDERVTGYVLIARDVTEAREVARRLTFQATHDSLTGLVNRAEFERRLTRTLDSGGEAAEHAICVLDLDGFKRVNDSCGHAAGDALLRQLSDVMAGQIRSRDTLARLGGDEFGILLERCPRSQAIEIAEQIRRAIGEYRFAHASQSYSVAASIGVSIVRAGAGEVSSLIQGADAACYLAKRNGGNRVEIADAERPPGAGSSTEWTRQLLDALHQQRFQLRAVAIHPIGQPDPVAPGLEVFVQLDCGGERLVAAGAFLPLARRHGMMPKVDHWVIATTIRLMSEWQVEHPGQLVPAVSINLDQQTVSQGGLVDFVRGELQRTGSRASGLCFEIDELTVTTSPATCTGVFRQLRGLGCRTAIDHCSGGIAVFGLLRRLGPDYLKIDGHLVDLAAIDPVSRIMLGALHDAAQVVGITTIATVVTSAEQLACLRQVGVPLAEGSALSPTEPFLQALGRLG